MLEDYVELFVWVICDCCVRVDCYCVLGLFAILDVCVLICCCLSFLLALLFCGLGVLCVGCL